MTWWRTILSALLILAGASLIALWAVSDVAVGAVDDGTAVHGIAVRAMDDPAIVAELGTSIGDEAVAALVERGLDPARLGLEDPLRKLISNAVASEDFRRALLGQVDAAHAQFSDQLTDSLRDPAPLVLHVDASDYVNEQIDSIPLIGGAVPDLTVPPVPVPVLDAETFEQVRSAYGVMETAQKWAMFMGIVLIVAGMFVTLRFRWFLSKTGLAIGAITGGLWLALHVWGVDVIVRALPGGSDGTLATMLTRVMTEAAVPALESRLATVAVWALGLALVFALVAVATGARGRDRLRA